MPRKEFVMFVGFTNLMTMFPHTASVQLCRVGSVTFKSPFQKSLRRNVASWNSSWTNFGSGSAFAGVDATPPPSRMTMRLFLPNGCLPLSSSSSSPPYISFHRQFSSSPTFTKASPRRKRQFIPRKAAVTLTDRARTFFQALLESNPEKIGVILNYQQASSGQPRMVFSFAFVTKDQISPEDEGVSLEILEDGTPKSPKDSMNDGLPKLYVHHNAFLKVLGATVDVNTETLTPILYDREGNIMDPNA